MKHKNIQYLCEDSDCIYFDLVHKNCRKRRVWTDADGNCTSKETKTK